jgi:hypothetical protein
MQCLGLGLPELGGSVAPAQRGGPCAVALPTLCQQGLGRALGECGNFVSPVSYLKEEELCRPLQNVEWSVVKCVTMNQQQNGPAAIPLAKLAKLK